MRITFLTPQPGLGGGIRAVAMYASELATLGHNVSIVSAGPKLLPWRLRLSHLRRGHGWWRPTRGASHFDSLTNIKRSVLPKHRPVKAKELPDADVLVATWWETAEWIAAMPASKGAKVYFVQHHETVFNNQPTDRVATTYRLPMAKVCCAGWLKDLMASDYGDATATVVPYGVDHVLFDAPPRGMQRRPTVGFMYSRATFKGTDVAIRACGLARERVPNLHVIAFGESEPASDCPLPDWIHFEHRPTQQRIAAIYASCDAWLFPSRCEGFGLPILEAMAARTPVIGTPTGIAPEAIGEGGGILTAMDDAASMAAAIERVACMSAQQWRHLSDKAFATAERFRWDSSARAFESCLIAAAGHQPSGATRGASPIGR